MKSNNPMKNVDIQKRFYQPMQSYPFDDLSALLYGEIRSALSMQGLLIGPNDLLIASIAIVNNLILATHNTKEFSRVPGLQIEDWECIS